MTVLLPPVTVLVIDRRVCPYLLPYARFQDLVLQCAQSRHCHESPQFVTKVDRVVCWWSFPSFSYFMCCTAKKAAACSSPRRLPVAGAAGEKFSLLVSNEGSADHKTVVGIPKSGGMPAQNSQGLDWSSDLVSC